ncbi:dihydrodipicolinate synthase family protein [Ilumatobacter sp.]|uniref:dihydrodipicolinate synthase family protein n=1 Tax=Ilumatobacter sp. TaxID=1967498 RepID=UPI0037524A4D
MLDQGSVALAINVDSGEGPQLSHGDKVRILETVLDTTDISIIAGIASRTTDASVRQAGEFSAAGANSLSSFGPPPTRASRSIPRCQPRTTSPSPRLASP